MRSLTFFSLLLGSVVSAQNWALLNPAYKYNYSNDGSDTISNQIFVTHIDTLGVDSFRYELNRIGVVCEGCSQGYTSGCWFGPMTDLVHANSPQGTGAAIRRSGSSWFMERSGDTMLILPQEPLGTSWTGPGNVSATIFAVMDSTLFGVTDSLKHIAFSTGDTVVISMDHGVRSMKTASSGSETLLLVGVSGSITVGLQYPAVLDLFNYQVGDVLQYFDESTFHSSFCVHFVEGRTKYQVLARTDEEGVSTYTLERTFSAHEDSYYPQMWTPCGTYNYEGQEQVSLVVEHDRFNEGNIFNSGLDGQLYPAVLDSVFLEPVANGLLTVISTSVDSLGRYVIEPNIVHSSGWEAALLCPSNEDSTMLFPTDDQYRFSITQGVGLTYLDWFRFESGATRTLEGYLLGGEQWGTIWSNSVILGERENSVEATTLFPNPATDVFVVTGGSGGVLTVHDLEGRAVLSSLLTSENTTVDVNTLTSGIYLVKIGNQIPQRLVIAR